MLHVNIYPLGMCMAILTVTSGRIFREILGSGRFCNHVQLRLFGAQNIQLFLKKKLKTIVKHVRENVNGKRPHYLQAI